ncbi:exodeoxyribonuclease V subunit beta [Comamonas serinivorans]|uniref:RecBCD enzyme subunit RecB n=1 Tax=Comamonas serinivorans TaxID=1082851 RepID=A0A1Y0ENP7_9BURK|nr:exodeoxyribonuclease V subunit beta [Comamonas serinivorans]ARU05216.1 exodeoxyribonuclease V subunit beta [Comamonas serinivorans]
MSTEWFDSGFDPHDDAGAEPGQPAHATPPWDDLPAEGGMAAAPWAEAVGREPTAHRPLDAAGAFDDATTARASSPGLRGEPRPEPRPLPTLDALRLPLRGAHLIEASAGTGKTYTIAQLYLRLVLGHGGSGPDGSGFVRALTPPEILVVTFTDAATHELRDRIRQRLGEAAAAFEAPAGDEAGAGDDLLRLKGDFTPEQWPGCARLLRVAADWMDEAAVSTIHSWCYRMLREHAFDSGNLFTQTLLSDESELLLQAAQDYWRQQFYALDANEARVLSQLMPGPEALVKAIRPLLAQDDAAWQFGDQALDPTVSPARLLAEVAQHSRESERLQDAARTAWAAAADRLERQFRTWLPMLNGQRYRGKEQHLETWLADLRRWSEGGDAPRGKGRKDIAYFGLSGIRLAGGQLPPPHPAFVAIDDWLAVADNEQAKGDHQALRAQLLAHATWQIRAGLAREKQRRAELGFDDVLRRLHQALTAPHGPVLAGRIRAQFPVAMIDEFQDTDPLQWGMFKAVYGAHADATETGEAGAAMQGDGDDHALLLIGDPKQAIYGFRGADIHTYLQARQATEGRHHSLGTNYRSTQAMVHAVNAVFGWAEAHFPEAAFRFAQGEGAPPWPAAQGLLPLGRDGGAGAVRRAAAANPMPFTPVVAHGRAERLVLAGQQASALTWWWLAPEAGQDTVSASLYRRHMAESCASQLVDWLTAVPQGDTGFLQADGRIRPLRPRDIAVLVRDRLEAEAIRQAMAARGIASAYLSERESVFDSREAQDLAVWLEAVHADAQARPLRAALGTASMGRSHAWLERLNHDEAVWDDMVQRFRGYRQLWLAQGVLPMVRQLLQDFALPSAWLAQPQGARTLTNMLHLAEWLQTQAPLHDSPQALLRELARQMDAPGEAGDAARLRLESDDDLIKVVTIHKSKGLEYPLVLLPFMASWKSLRAHTSLLLPANEASDGRRVNLDPKDPADKPLAELERQREDLRLTYVALTRAQHAVWLGVAPLVVGQARDCQVHESAIGYLVGGTRPRSGPAFAQQVQALCDDSDQAARALGIPGRTMQRLPAPAIHSRRWAGEAAAPRRIVTRAAPPRHWQPWWIASYSALTSDLLHEDGLTLPMAGELPADALAQPAGPGAADPADGRVAQGQQRDGVNGVWIDSRHPEIGKWSIPRETEQGLPTRPHAEPESPASEDAFELALASHVDAQLALAQQEAREAALDDTDWDGLRREAARLAAPPQGLHAFARGAEVGTFWHELLQLAAMQGFARMAEAPDKLGELVARRARVRGWGDQAPALTQWLLQWLHMPLPLQAAAGHGLPDLPAEPAPTAPTVRLVDLPAGRMQAELEFWLPVHDAAAQRIDAVVRAHIEPGWARPALSPLRLRGMLKGYMDVVFEAPRAATLAPVPEAGALPDHDASMAVDVNDEGVRNAANELEIGSGAYSDEAGRFYVLDYKSNWLGPDDASYHPDAVRAAALANRYDLQAALYALALHRLLRTRLPDYDPARHLGGSLTWFLRGSARADGGVWGCAATPALLDELDALFEAAGHVEGQA